MRCLEGQVYVDGEHERLKANSTLEAPIVQPNQLATSDMLTNGNRRPNRKTKRLEQRFFDQKSESDSGDESPLPSQKR
jgi:hypothetical protein